MEVCFGVCFRVGFRLGNVWYEAGGFKAQDCSEVSAVQDVRVVGARAPFLLRPLSQLRCQRRWVRSGGGGPAQQKICGILRCRLSVLPACVEAVGALYLDSEGPKLEAAAAGT